MKNFLYTICICFAFIQLHAQKYNTIGGIRMGDDLGFTVKQRIADKLTAEIIYSDGLITDQRLASANIQSHHRLLGKRLNFYLGAGYLQTWAPSEISDEAFTTQTGIPLVIGAEFTIGRLNISTDVMPIYYLTGVNKSNFSRRSGISIRYVFWKRKSSKKKLWEKLKFWN